MSYAEAQETIAMILRNDIYTYADRLEIAEEILDLINYQRLLDGHTQNNG